MARSHATRARVGRERSVPGGRGSARRTPEIQPGVFVAPVEVRPGGQRRCVSADTAWRDRDTSWTRRRSTLASRWRRRCLMVNDRIAVQERCERLAVFRARVAVVFERLPVLCGFQVTHDLSVVEVAVHGWPGWTPRVDLHGVLCAALEDLIDDAPRRPPSLWAAGPSRAHCISSPWIRHC
jgi:hypothetical protein